MERIFFCIKPIVCACFFAFVPTLMASATQGSLEGRVIVPSDVDPSSVVIQTLGMPQNTPLQTSPDAQGYFHFDHIFPVGSSVTLMAWDPNGVLNRQMFFAYVSPNGGTYHLYLEKNSFVQSLSQSFGLQQNLVSSGVCGQVTGLSEQEIQGSYVTLQENNTTNEYQASYFNESNLPAREQNFLAALGYFCFFNVPNTTNAFDYTLSVHLKNSLVRSFHLSLPPYTFANNLIFDVQTALYRPAKMFSWKSDDATGWDLVPKGSLATSQDYAQVKISSDQNDLIYFPVGEEFLTMTYGLNSQSADRFFVLQPRSSLFNRDILASIKQYEPGQTYVDPLNPVVVKILDPKSLAQQDLNQSYGQNQGALFLNFDFSDFNVTKNNLVIQLNQLSGESISNFVEQQNVNENNKQISGFFHNLPAGSYQLVIKDERGQLLWTSIVRSMPNKIQVLSNVSSAKILINKQMSSLSKQKNQAYTKVFVSEKEAQSTPMTEIFPVDPALYRPEEPPRNLHQEQVYLRNNLFFRVDAQTLCTKNQETDNKNQERFMGYIPIVALFGNKTYEPI